MHKPDKQSIFLGVVIAVVLGVGVYTFCFYGANGQAGGNPQTTTSISLQEIPFRGENSYQYLKDICDLGPRLSGSPAMKKQQEMLKDHFTKLGGRVSFQRFTHPHPEDGSDVEMANMIVQWHPQRKQRILLCAHYDTRPFPDRDPTNPWGLFLGANDGASGAALLAEMANHMPGLRSRYGVDFVLFDGEEFVFNDRRDKGNYFIGSTYFAEKYVSNPPPYQYRWGVLVDMVGDKDLQIYQEKNSLRWSDTRPLVREIWKTADRLGVKEFISRGRHVIRDDHLPLRNKARIPTCDIIDFDYPNPTSSRRGNSYWHTEDDIPENCSAESLAKVGWVLLEWLKTAE